MTIGRFRWHELIQPGHRACLIALTQIGPQCDRCGVPAFRCPVENRAHAADLGQRMDRAIADRPVGRTYVHGQTIGGLVSGQPGQIGPDEIHGKTPCIAVGVAIAGNPALPGAQYSL